METSANFDGDVELKGIPEHIRSKLIEMKTKLDGIESIVNKMDSKRDEEIQSGKNVSNITGLNQSLLYSSTVNKLSEDHMFRSVVNSFSNANYFCMKELIVFKSNNSFKI